MNTTVGGDEWSLGRGVAFGPTKGATATAIGSRFFYWPELRVRDVVGAARFYAGLVGGSIESSRGDDLLIIGVAGRPVAAVSEIGDRGQVRDLGGHWRLYVVFGRSAVGARAPYTSTRTRLASVPGAHLAAELAAGHFGDACRAGAEAVLWTEPGGGESAHPRGEDSMDPAALLQAAIDDDDPVGPGPHLFHNQGERALSGVLVGSIDGAGAPISNVCLSVDECGAALRRAQAAGATIVDGPTDLASGGRVAPIIDPFGVPSFCWQPAPSGRLSLSPPRAGRPWPRAHRARPSRIKNA
jgi:predicted enzyme related to lactoylglutathione lyase